MLEAPLPAEETARLQALHRLDILDTPTEERFDRLTALVREWLDVPVAVLSLVDAERQWFKSKSGGTAARGTCRSIAFCAHGILDDAPLVVEDALADPRFHDNPLVTGDDGVRFYAGVPITTSDGHRLGMLCAIDHRPRAISATALHALGQLARVAADLIELRLGNRRLACELERRIRTEAELTHLAFHDPLTDLANRRAFLMSLDAQCARADAGEPASTLMLLDLDRFKAVNDSLGHDIGDAVLLELAARLRRSVRRDDVPARLGGDEFAVLLAGMHAAEDAARWAERIAAAIAEPFAVGGLHVTTGVSIGIARLPDDGATPTAVLKAADAALYRAKADGRQGHRFAGDSDTTAVAPRARTCAPIAVTEG